MSDQKLSIWVKGPLYFSQEDETAFFEWLRRLKCVKQVGGVGNQVEIRLRRSRLTHTEFRELLALFHRYSMNNRPLRRFAREDMKWVWDRQAYWYRGLFGEGH